LLLIANRKSHTVFRLVPTSVTLNDIERRNGPYYCFILPDSLALQAYYVIVVEDRPILSAEYCLTLLAQTDPLCSVVSLR